MIMKQFLLVAAVLLCGSAGAVGGVFSLNARAWLYGPLYQSARYDGFGGPWRALIEGLYAMCAAALVGSRAAWLGGGFVSRAVWKRPIPGGSVVTLDVIVLGVMLVWVYLIWASW